jgi:phosphopantothenoylcysteine synthetase/decarboxylase
MQNKLSGKCIVLGVTGSIAAYKAADLCSKLTQAGADVHIVMTASAQKFITPLTLATMSRNPVGRDLWEAEGSWQPGHIELADKADLLLVAPATAHVIAQFAQGLAPDLLTCIYLATLAPVMLAPAMNGKMLDHPATVSNMEILRKRGHQILPTDEGMLACGYAGKGKLTAVELIFAAVENHFAEG